MSGAKANVLAMYERRQVPIVQSQRPFSPVFQTNYKLQGVCVDLGQGGLTPGNSSVALEWAVGSGQFYCLQTVETWTRLFSLIKWGKWLQPISTVKVKDTKDLTVFHKLWYRISCQILFSDTVESSRKLFVNLNISQNFLKELDISTLHYPKFKEDRQPLFKAYPL